MTIRARHPQVATDTYQDKAWYAIVTRFRNEKHVARLLEKKGIETFLPLHRVTRKYASGKKSFDLPLISCYVFPLMHLRDHVKVLETPGVIKFVRFCNDIVKVPEEDILTMQRVIRGDYPMEVLDHEISTGDEVEVTAGSLIGVRGSILQINNRKRFVISITNIGRSITIEIDARLLRPVRRSTTSRKIS